MVSPRPVLVRTGSTWREERDFINPSAWTYFTRQCIRVVLDLLMTWHYLLLSVCAVCQPSVQFNMRVFMYPPSLFDPEFHCAVFPMTRKTKILIAITDMEPWMNGTLVWLVTSFESGSCLLWSGHMSFYYYFGTERTVQSWERTSSPLNSYSFEHECACVVLSTFDTPPFLWDEDECVYVHIL